ncbi:Cation/H(+) antiporter 15 [Dichanthelium oligosanthes]|uniref:Cation/H(+) antiporter 15 n=1 Tax=Dichanthelium oligosanthes TaxID=888268 RepID=A0A1E5VEV3_9POAL|nr:Cation/H(+) antiporter 15 [Dichanthelium oligosanthes]
MSMVLITAMSTPLIKLLYDPSGQFVRAKRRALEDARPSADLRVLTCLYSEDHAAPLIDPLEASGSSRDSPVSLIVLHLTELVGRAVSMLKPHRKSSGGGNPTPSDRIMNAFRYFEQQAASGAVTVSPYVAQPPYSSMHHSRKANLILLPFHKSSDGARSTANNAIRPSTASCCSTRPAPSPSSWTTASPLGLRLQRAALYFLGGPDDREALTYTAWMPNAGSMSLASGGGKGIPTREANSRLRSVLFAYRPRLDLLRGFDEPRLDEELSSIFPFFSRAWR